MDRNELLQHYIDLETEDLYRYYGMPKPKLGYEEKWRSSKDRIKGLEEMQEFVTFHEVPDYLRDACIMKGIAVTKENAEKVREERLARSKDYVKQVRKILLSGESREMIRFRISQLSTSNP